MRLKIIIIAQNSLIPIECIDLIQPLEQIEIALFCIGFTHVNLYFQRVSWHVNSHCRTLNLKLININFPEVFSLCSILFHGITECNIKLRIA